MYDDWSAVLTARARAVREYELHKEEAGPGARTRLFDAALLTWLTVVPPDRVGVARKLQLGVTLKPTAGGGFELDLSTPDAHKTAAIFGPSTTAVPAAACALLQAWLADAGRGGAHHRCDGQALRLRAGQPRARRRRRRPLQGARRAALDRGRQGWAQKCSSARRASQGPAQLVCHVPAEQRQPGRGPQEGRAGALVGQAMRHSTALQGSATYDKERAERSWAAAVQVAGAFAARFE